MHCVPMPSTKDSEKVLSVLIFQFEEPEYKNLNNTTKLSSMEEFLTINIVI